MNEILNQRIQSVRIGKDITHAQQVAKRHLREDLETEMEKFLARGGVVKQAVNQVDEVKHGRNTQYTKRGCRCEICVAWALDKGVIKTTTLRGKA